jgi:hypothetical protein
MFTLIGQYIEAAQVLTTELTPGDDVMTIPMQCRGIR